MDLEKNCLNNNSYSTIVDINECRSHNGGCNHHCTNSHGSFRCSCNNGYSLQRNKKTCVGKYIVINIHVQIITVRSNVYVIKDIHCKVIRKRVSVSKLLLTDMYKSI